MTRIEEIFFEAFELGVHNKLYNTAYRMINSSEYKYIELYKVYEIALEKEKEFLNNNNNLYEHKNSSEVHQ